MSKDQQFFCPECGAEGTLDARYDVWRRVKDPYISEYGKLHWNREADPEERLAGYRCSQCQKELSEERVSASIKTRVDEITIKEPPEAAVFYVARGWLSSMHDTPGEQGLDMYVTIKEALAIGEEMLLEQYLIPISRMFVQYVLNNVDLNMVNGFWQYELETDAAPILAKFDACELCHMAYHTTDNTDRFDTVIREMGWYLIKDHKDEPAPF